MSLHHASSRHVLIGLLFCAITTGAPARAQVATGAEKQALRVTAPAAPDDAASAEEAREQRGMERFLSLLEKNPRRGTPLDRVYGYHVERGSLDACIKSYRDRIDKNPNDGTAWLILGLLEFQRGQDAAAVTALTKAEETRKDDPLPSYYLGQALVLIGQPENAALAFERALTRKPPRTDLLDIFQALGRVYQRTQKNDQALEVWNRLEAIFPGDPRVQEQIAAALAEENQPAAALPRFEALAKKASDPFRQVQLAISAADLKVRLGRSQDALHDFEAMLAKLRPDSWLHREVRRKIEEVFLRNDDQAGLVAYYQTWTKKEPDDVEALVRLGRALAAMGRAAEAQTWWNKAVKLAPSRRDLRLALISQLAQDQKFAEAAKEYEALDQAEPNNPDTLRDWGSLVLRDTTKTQAERKAGAAAVWRKMLDAKPNDAVTTAQVADLLRQAELTDQALELYRKAATLAPTNPQYHEYIGEYLHNLKRPDEAKAAWAKIAEPPNRNAKTLARLSEVLSGFGYIQEALPPLTEAVRLEPDSFDPRLKLAALDHRLEQFDDAEAELTSAQKLAERDEEKDAVLEARVKNDQAAGRLTQRAETLRKELEGDGKSTAAAWCNLARYLEADTKLPEAVRAAEKAALTDPRSIPAWTLLARVRESAGSLGDAAAALGRLAEIDRRNRTEHLTGVARLEARLGRVEPALKAGRDLLAAAPGNPETYEFFAQLCFNLGKPEEGLDALRRAVRANPNESSVVLRLAETLAGQYQTDEAIEMYWRAFDRSEELDHKLDVVKKLTELYLQRGQLDRLFARLQHQERDDRPADAASRGRDVAMCLAQAHASSGDMGAARAELERLLATDTRDTRLLWQLSKLAEEEGDLENAARYQKMHEDLAPNDEGQARLASLLAKSGDLEEAQAVWSKAAAGKSQSFRVFLAMDNLLLNGKPLPVLEITEASLRADPQDWEALYRQGLALEALRRPRDAAATFQKLIDLPVGDDEKSAYAKAQARNPRFQASGAPRQLAATSRQSMTPLESRVSNAYMIRYFCKLTPTPPPRGYSWSPADFGQARMAAIGWLVSLAGREQPGGQDEFIAGVRAASLKTPGDHRAIWNWFYLCNMLLDHAGCFDAARNLSSALPRDPLALWAFLDAIRSRAAPLGQRAGLTSGTALFRQWEENVTALERQDVDQMIASFRGLRSRRPELAQGEIILSVARELRLARRVDDEDQIYRETVQGASQLGQLAGAIDLAGARGDVSALIQLFERYDRLQAGRSTIAYTTASYSFTPSRSLCQAVNACADRKDYSQLLKLVDSTIDAARRKSQQQSPGAAARARRSRRSSFFGAGVVPLYSIPVGSGSVRVAIAYPQDNEYLDSGVILMLRTAFEVYKRDDLLSDLVNHFRRQAATAPTPADANYPRLCLSAMLWWNDERDEAVAELTKVVDAAGPDSDLRLALANLYLQQGSPADAINLLDAVQPMDNASLERRETLAITAAIAAGNANRARQAAERLFGLRLDTDTQIRLSGQMRQLGLPDLADALLGRARRRAGGQSRELVELMTQFQRQGKLEQAAQIALQLLRSSRSSLAASRSSLDAETVRPQAMRILAASGRLPQLIERTREQLKNAPDSVAIHQTLADYYTAARQTDLAAREMARILELKHDDADLRLRLAVDLAAGGNTTGALAHYKAVFDKKPDLAADGFLQILTIFERAGKTAALIELANTLDLKTLSLISYSLIARLLYSAPDDSKMSGQVQTLFRKAWAAYPDTHQYLLRMNSRRDFWEMPEAFDYACESVLPSDPANLTSVEYSPFGWPAPSSLWPKGPTSQSGDNLPVVLRLLDLAEERGSLDRLLERIEEARKKVPKWKTVAALKAMVLCRAGRFDEARVLVPQAIAAVQNDPVDLLGAVKLAVFWALGLELEKYPATSDLALSAYQACLADPGASLQFRYLATSERIPVRQLVPVALSTGRRDEARRNLLDLARSRHSLSIASDELLTILRMIGLDAIGTSLVELGFAADAVPLFRDALVLSERADLTAPAYLFPNLPEAPRLIEQHLKAAIEKMSASELTALAGRSIAEAAREPVRDMRSATGAGSTPDRTAQVIDLVTMVHPRNLDKASVRSLIADSLDACDPTELAKLLGPLKVLRQAHPGDLSVATCDALEALAAKNDARTLETLERLAQVVEQSPLERLPAGVRANARERAQAAGQISLWLVARAAWRAANPSVQAHGDRFAERALEAARRQDDRAWLLAMLREQGQLAFDRGDRATAARIWSGMLERVVTPQEASPRGNGPGSPAPGRRPISGPASQPTGASSRTVPPDEP